ncbi:MAG TPA: hypothetical protein VGD64_09195 [Acidisarcina sp.]
MNGLSIRDPQVFKTLLAGAAVVGGVVLYNAFRKRPDPVEIERQRRADLVQLGRTIDGTLLDVTELEASPEGKVSGGKIDGAMELILYQYEIAGVVYECSQDVTALKDFVNIQDCRIGFPATIRYDARRPENSIIVAENWSGLRESAQQFKLREPTCNPAGATIPRR